MNEAKEKELILERIQSLAMRQIVSKEEVDVAYYKGISDRTHPQENVSEPSEKIGMTEILYYIGGAVVFFGIVILVKDNWFALSMPLRILVTLGSGIIAYASGFLLSRNVKTAAASPAFYLIFALVTPIGLSIVFNNSADYAVGSAAVQSYIAGILFLICFVSHFAFRKDTSKNPSATLFAFFSVLFGTWLFFAVTDFIASPGAYVYPVLSGSDISKYKFMIVGLAYVLLGYSFPPLAEFLYSFGVLAFLGAALALGGWAPSANSFWEIIFPFLVFGVLFLSVRLKSKSFLIFGSLFLTGYIFKITDEYFRSDVGWPLMLVLAGLLLIAIGWTSFYLNKKYISK